MFNTFEEAYDVARYEKFNKGYSMCTHYLFFETPSGWAYAGTYFQQAVKWFSLTKFHCKVYRWKHGMFKFIIECKG